MSLLADVVAHLDTNEAPFALIGAAAMATLGVSRSTIDIDLLTTNRVVLRKSVWAEVEDPGTQVDIRWGDISDPLVGVVRLSRGQERPVDIIVGEAPWQETILGEARPFMVIDVEAPVVNEVGLVLLKLYAGGPQDLWDIQQLLLNVADSAEVARTVTERIGNLPMRCKKLWDKIEVS